MHLQRHPEGRIAGNGADRYVDLTQERRVDPLTFEHATSQPGVQPELQPLAGEAGSLQRAPAEAVPPGFPSLPYRAEGMQVGGRWHGAVVRVVPPQLEAGIKLVRWASRGVGEGLKCVERHGSVPGGGGHHAQPWA